VHTSEARVREWMTADPITASPDMPLDEAAQIMLDNEFRHLPVVEGEQVQGVVSLRRVVAASAD
jgi:acetoin utilization protein AcuB